MSYKTEISVKLSCDNCGRDLKNNEECLVLYDCLDDEYVFCNKDCYKEFLVHNTRLTNYHNIKQEFPILHVHKLEFNCSTCGKDLTKDEYASVFTLNHDEEFKYFCSERCLHKYWLTDYLINIESADELINNKKDDYHLEYDW